MDKAAKEDNPASGEKSLRQNRQGRLCSFRNKPERILLRGIRNVSRQKFGVILLRWV